MDKSGKIWVGTDGDGAMIFDPIDKKMQKIENNLLNNYSISSNAIRSIFEDADQNIWVGTFKGGLNLTNNNRNNAFQWHTHIPLQNGSITNNNVTAVLEDDQKTLWIGTDGGGLNYRQTGSNSFNHMSLKEGFNNILAIYQSEDGNLKFGSFLNGYCIYNPHSFTKTYINNNDGLSGNDIRGFADYLNNEIVIINDFGINIRNKKTGSVSFIQQKDIISDTTLSNGGFLIIYKDSQDNLWLGTYYGLYRLDIKSKKIISFFQNEYKFSIKGEIIFSILEDRDGYMWFGTNRGLNRLNIPVWRTPEFSSKNKKNLTFTNYSIEDNLTGNLVYSLIQDKNSNIWMGTNEGLVRFNKQKSEFISYPISDGIIEPVFNPSACCKTSDGKLLFGTQNGLIEFDPDSIINENSYDSVALTGILINYKPLNEAGKDHRQMRNIIFAKSLKISYNENTVTFKFVTPNFYLPEKVKYAYKLKNFDNNWIIAQSNSRIANYTNLPAGTYQFKVKASTPGGKWSNNVQSIQIIITPPFWEQWWFNALVILIAIALIYGFIHLRILKIKQQKKRLELLVDHKTLEILEGKRKQLKEEEKNRILELRRKEAESEKLRIENELIVLKNEKLKALVDRKNTDIDKKSAELALNVFKMSNKNELISKIAHELKLIADKSNETTGEEIHSLISKLKVDNQRQSEWQKFESYFDNVHEKFYLKLNKQFPNLSLAEKKLCAYLKMNLSSKEISGISNITIKSVETERSRLRKKLGLDQSESLIEFINKI